MIILRLILLYILFSSKIFANQLPLLGDSSSSIISLDQEYQLGQAWLSLARNNIKIIDDPLTNEYLENSIKNLAQFSEIQDHRLTFLFHF